MAHHLDAFSNYFVRTKNGDILVRESIEKFSLDLGFILNEIRVSGSINQQFVEKNIMQASVNWTEQVSTWISEANGATDKAAIGEIVNKFSTLLHSSIKAEAEAIKKKAEADAKRQDNIYLSFEDFGTEVHPEAQIVSNVIAILGLRGGAAIDETKNVLDEIDAMAEQGILGWIKGRGLILMKTKSGKPTAAFVHESKIKTDILKNRPKRGRQGSTSSQDE